MTSFGSSFKKTVINSLLIEYKLNTNSIHLSLLGIFYFLFL